MKKRILKYVALPVLILLLAVSAFLFRGVNFTYTFGGKWDLEIGMSKESALTELRAMGVKQIEPVVAEYISITRSSIELLPQLISEKGICTTNHMGFTFYIKLDKAGTVANIYTSRKAESINSKIKLGDTIDAVLAQIKDILEHYDGIRVFNCIHEPNLIFDERYAEFDHWFFYLPESYSMAVLHFSDDKLRKIEYHWRFSELY